MSKGRRYSGERKLNYKKVFAVIIAFLVLIMFILVIKNLLAKGKETGRISGTNYYSVYQNNKWGIINQTGEIIIEPSYQEIVVVPNSKQEVFLCTYDINDETGEYHTKALNAKNEEIFTQYDQIEPLENYDENKQIYYEQNLLKVAKDGKYGLIDFLGKEILPLQYEEIDTLKEVDNSILIKQNGKYGLVNSEGSIIIEPQYKEIKNLGSTYEYGYITVTEDNKYGLVDNLNKVILANEYEKIDQIEGKDLFVIEENKKQKVVNKEGIVVIEKGFDKIKSILNQSSGVIFEENSKYGVMDAEGKEIIPADYEDIIEGSSSTYIAQKNRKYGVIDKNKDEKIGFYYEIISYYPQASIYVAEDKEYNATIFDSSFTEKLKGVVSEVNEKDGYLKIRVGDESRYYNFKFEQKEAKDILTANNLFLAKQDGKYGVVNTKGEVVVDYQYEDAIEQNIAGYIAIKKDGKWGSIGPNGQVALEPTYDLEDYLVIDFVGKWHLGKDANMNYYTDQ